MKFVYKLVIEYNGKNFYGSQRQCSLRTVEGVLLEAIGKILDDFELMISSRTDSGVHSLGNVARLISKEKIKEEKFLLWVNYILPSDLKVRKIKRVGEDFNPRKDVKYKVYQYKIFNSKIAPVLEKGYCWWVRKEIDIIKLAEAIDVVKGKKRFDFATTKEYILRGKSTVCDLQIGYKKVGDVIVLKFIARRFLHRMIRNIVRLIVDVSTGSKDIEELKEIIRDWDYCKIYPAPASGLTLVRIVY